MLGSLIQEMAKYEHLPFLMTEEILASDGFGAQARFRVLVAALIPDDLWNLIAPLLPPARSKPKGGRPRTPDRACLARP
jgi:hypothetical protein